MPKEPQDTVKTSSVDDRTRAPSARLETLDGLRLVAALAVLCYHYFYRGSIEGGYLNVSYGVSGGVLPLLYLGVNLFFMISGFVIMRSAEARSAWAFGVSRFTRLYPAHFAAMTLTALIMAAWSAAPFIVTPGGWLANLTMMAPAFGHPFMDGAYWSIVVEIIFYGWVALALLAGILPRRTDLFAGAWLAIILINNLLLQSSLIERLFLTNYGGNFAFGILIYQITRHGFSHVRVAMVVLAVLLSLLGAERERVELLNMFGVAPNAQALALAQMATAVIFLAAIGLSYMRRVQTGLADKRPIARFIAVAAGISYPLYLFHQHAGYIIINWLSPTIGKWSAAAVAATIVILVAWAIWRFAEPIGKRMIDFTTSHLERIWFRLRGDHVAPAE